MTNTSATGGYLVPSTPAPADDEALQVIFQGLVGGVTGIVGDLVRPRWQKLPPPEPSIDTSWCAIGVTDSEPDDGAAILHHSAGDGSDEMQRHETLFVIASFYGPAASQNAALLRDGLALPQNREAIRAQGIAFVEIERAVLAPSLVNQQWRRHVDVRMTFRRQVTRTYPVLNLLSAGGDIASDPASTTPWTTE
ncbi:hypothetical protein LB518_22775 [Mesorhizobium sp. BR1-1-16]|uniref:phage neck terminator protein n=1 Tax=Mesorhizobium sp. BR1-1-16 TaxID=2876653 RepID=UPI001CCB3EA8|nr:hypothetical protein [Mesorhizobium sp. BR1-1-16]MBZ9939139.1 hypothetical protein [Mesorhizobium sp. BR1-1-16]